ncbi:MAG: hypothetical protein ACSLEM_00985 [Candidatus Malihini olakiniferum]
MPTAGYAKNRVIITIMVFAAIVSAIFPFRECTYPHYGLPSGNAVLPCGRCLYRMPLLQKLIFVSDS